MAAILTRLVALDLALAAGAAPALAGYRPNENLPIGTEGATIPLNNGDNDESGLWKFRQGVFVGTGDSAIWVTPKLLSPLVVRNASGSSRQTVGSMSAGSAALTLDSALDFANGQGVLVVGAGATFSASAPTATASVVGAAGSTTYTYKIASVDAAGGVGAPVTTSVSNGAATLSAANRVAIAITPGSGAAAYVIWKQTNGGSWFYLYSGQGTTYVDTGLQSYDQSGNDRAPHRPWWVPSTPPSSSQNDWLVTTIADGGGTTNLTVADRPANGVSGATVLHDDTAAITACVNAGGSNNDGVGASCSLPCGYYRISSPIAYRYSNSGLQGARKVCTFIASAGASDDVTITGTQKNFLREIDFRDTGKAAGWGLNASGAHAFALSEVDFDHPYSGMRFYNSNDLTLAHARVFSFFSQQGSILAFQSSATGTTCCADITDVYGYSYGTLGDSSTAQVAYLMDGKVETIVCRNCDVSDISGDEVRTSNAVGSSGQPQFIQFSDLGAEFATGWNVNLLAGLNLEFVNGLTHAGHKGNFASCAASGGLHVGPGVTKWQWIGGGVANATGSGVSIEGDQGQFANAHVHWNSANGDGGTAGACNGVDVAATVSGLTVTGNTIGDAIHPTWQAYPVTIANGATNVSVTGNAWTGNVNQTLVNNAASPTVVAHANAGETTRDASPEVLVTEASDYGVDPTGVADSTDAINLAARTGTNSGNPTDGAHPLTCVHVAAGNYKVTDALTLPKDNSCLYGDGPTRTVFNVASTSFNLSAPGVVYAPPNGGATGPILRDFGIAFSQPDTAVRANLVAFPPGVFMQNVGRLKIQNVRIGGGSFCIDARGNTGGAFYDNVECGSLVKGLLLGGPDTIGGGQVGALDGVHISGWHFWNFGVPGSMAGLHGIATDGTNISIEAGRVDWLGVTDSENSYGNINVLADASNSADQWQFTNLSMDGARWLQAGGTAQIANLQNATAGTGPNGAAGGWPTIVSVSGGARLTVNGYRIGSYQGSDFAVAVNGGTVTLADGTLQCSNPAYSCANVSGGTLTIHDSEMAPAGSGVWAAPFVGQTGGSLRYYDNRFNTAAGAGVGVAFAADDGVNSWNYFARNQMTGWGLTQPTQSESQNSVFGPVFIPSTDPTSMQVATDSTGISLWSAANTVGDTLFGHNAGAKINPVGGAGGGYGITAFGNGAAKNATSAIGTTAFGSGACNALTTGVQATCIGNGAGAGVYGTRGGSGMTAVGFQALQNAWGTNNTALGADTGQALHGGSSNLLLGQGVASSTLSTGSRNIYLGTSSNCDAATAGESDVLRICETSGSTPLIKGNLDPANPGVTIDGVIAGGMQQATLAYSGTGANALPVCNADRARTTAWVSDGASLTGVCGTTYSPGAGTTTQMVACDGGGSWTYH